MRGQRFSLDERGVTIVEAMVSFALASLLMIGMATFVRNQGRSLKGIATLQARDGLVRKIEQVIKSPQSVLRSASFAGSGGFASNVGTNFAYCVLGSASPACNANTAGAFTLVDPLGVPVASGVYSNAGGLCGAVGSVTPDSVKCSIVVDATMTANCPSAAATCTQAQTVTIQYVVRQAAATVLAEGRLKTFSGSAVFNIPISEGMACPQAGMTRVGAPAARDTYCIDNNPRGPATLFAAHQACYALNMHVCDPREWITACQTSGLSASMTGTGEMVAAPYADSYDLNAKRLPQYGQVANKCLSNTRVMDAYIDTQRYRCCGRGV